MGRTPCCDKSGLKKGPWTPEEDQKLVDYIQSYGHGSWRTLPKNAGLSRCGKSCRLRWTNYLRPDIKRGRFSFEEEETIIQLHSILGNKWSAIAGRLPGRTDNEIKNYWNTHIRKRLLRMGIDPVTHAPRLDLIEHLSSLLNPLLYNPRQSGLSRLLSAIDPLMNSELLWLASNLLQTNQTHNHSHFQAQDNHVSQPQNKHEMISSHNLQNQAQDSNLGDISYALADNNDMSMVQHLDPWDELAFSDLQTHGNMIGHDSSLSTPAVSSPAINNSCSTYLNSSTDFDEKESYCSDDFLLDFQIPDLLDVNEFL